MVGDCSVTERWRWRPPYQTGKTVHVHAKHYKHNEDGRTAPDVYRNGSVPLSHSENVVTRIGNTHTSVRLIHYTWYDVSPLNSIGNIWQNHWTMHKGEGHWKLHGCIAAAALKGICYLTKYELSGLKGVHKNETFRVKKQWQTPKSVNCDM